MMNEQYIRHDNLVRLIRKFREMGEDTPDEDFIRIFQELKYSWLLTPAKVSGDVANPMFMDTPMGKYGALFTDIDEFRKEFPDFETGFKAFPFPAYLDYLNRSDMKGFIINFRSDGFLFTGEWEDLLGEMPEIEYSTDGAYTSDELKRLRDSVDNENLEEFIANPQNIGKYEELFEIMSDSTLLTFIVSDEDLSHYAEDGVIPTRENGYLGNHYMEGLGGKYGTIYTSEDKISRVDLAKNKYSQIVNLSQMMYSVLTDDMDGIIINPGEENVILTREVLLDFSDVIEKTCNDSRLNSAINYMFEMEED